MKNGTYVAQYAKLRQNNRGLSETGSASVLDTENDNRRVKQQTYHFTMKKDSYVTSYVKLCQNKCGLLQIESANTLDTDTNKQHAK